MTAVYESFRYIHPPDYDHKYNEVMENKYKTKESLDGKFITYAPGLGYRIYPDVSEFLVVLNKLPESERVFHEVIFDQPQKLKFDIDAPLEKLAKFEIPINIDDATPTDRLGSEVLTNEMKYINIFETILQTIRDAFFIVYGKELPEECEIICESKDLTKSTQTKFSNHIIIDNFFVNNCSQAHEFTRRVTSFLPERYRPFLDLSVNKRIQNFRIVNCHKSDNRIKRVVRGNPAGAFITDTHCGEALQDIVVMETKSHFNNQTLHPDDIRDILKKIREDGSALDHKFKFVRKGMFIFSRLRPSYCDFCTRRHDSDNTLVITTQTIGGVIKIYKQCRKYIEEHGNQPIFIGEIPSSIAPIEITNEADQKTHADKLMPWIERQIQRTVTELKSNGELFSTRLLFDDLPTSAKNVYSEPTLHPFELTHTLVVHAAMKMGKTKALLDYIKKYFSSELNPPTIRFVSFRQTFSGNIKEKFADFALYSDTKGPLDHRLLIVQVESLYRLDLQEGTNCPDLLVLDECESIFEQFDSGLLRGNFNECFAKFQYLLRYSKHVVCMDANISDRTYRILESMRPEFASPTSGVVYHCNRHKNATDDHYWITGDKLKWLGLLYSSIEADERIAIPMSSLIEAKTLLKNLQKKYPEKNLKLYSSETLMSEKKEHFSDVNEHWRQFDILMYTPTVSAGVSFEQKHFTKVFGYFTDQSCPVETCIQMIGRIRDVADHQFYICIAASGNNQPTDIDTIRQMIYDRRDNLVRNFDDTGLIIEYGPSGELIRHTGPYFQLFLENLRVKNLSKNSFIRRFIHIISTTGAHVDLFTDRLFEQNTGLALKVDGELNTILADIQAIHDTARVEVREETIKKIATAKELDDSQIEEIHYILAAQKDLPDDLRWAFEKYRLRVDYNHSGPDCIIDEKFVSKYHDRKVRRMYKNISRICSHETIESAWTQIQAEERANHKYLMDLGAQSQDLNRKYVFDQHRYALSLLKLCGWKNINDPQFIHQVVLIENLRSGEKLYWENIKHACTEFGIKSPSLQTAQHHRGNPRALIDFMIAPINKILGSMYGINITTRKKDTGMFFLNHNKLFTLDPGESRAKNKPLISPAPKAFSGSSI